MRVKVVTHPLDNRSLFIGRTVSVSSSSKPRFRGCEVYFRLRGEVSVGGT